MTLNDLTSKCLVIENRINNMETNFKSYVDEQRERDTEFLRESREFRDKLDKRTSRLEKIGYSAGGAVSLILLVLEVYKLMSEHK